MRAVLRIAVVVLPLIAASIVVAGPSVAIGTTYTVTTFADPDSPTCPSASNCSLRGAVAATTDGDVVVLGAGTYTLTSGELVLNHGITIRGAGRSATTIDASAVAGPHRVIRVRGVVSRHVIITGVAITGGAFTGTGDRVGGGGIAHNDTIVPLYLRDVRIYGNSVSVSQGSSQGGGGIRSEASVYLADSIVEDNTVNVTDGVLRDGGGGVYIADGSGHGNLVMSNSIIRNNTVTITSAQPPLYCLVPIPGTTCPSNHGGGGAFVDGEDLVLTNSFVSGNSFTVTNAYGESGGGGVFVNTGDITATRSVLSGNSATVATTTDVLRPASNEGGGAIYQNGHDVVLTGSTVSGNTLTVTGAETTSDQDATNGGGGIYQFGNRLQITGSTISGNTATVPASLRSGGGGIYDNGNAETITNSTIAGNTAVVGPDSESNPEVQESNGGGGIFLVGVRAGIQLTNVTIAGNAAPSAAGGGILSYTNAGPTWPLLQDSIVAGNSSAVPDSTNCWATRDAQITSLGWNLADDTANSCGFTATGDLIANPKLGPLAANGGPTRTMALAATSPAVNAGDPAGCGAALGPVVRSDQRGVARPAGAPCDIGAYELSPPKAVTARALGNGASATLRGTAVNGDARSGSAYFQYGHSTRYGSRTRSVPVAALTRGQPVLGGITARAPGTYHYRLVVVNRAGKAVGRDAMVTFKRVQCQVVPRQSLTLAGDICTAIVAVT